MLKAILSVVLNAVPLLLILWFVVWGIRRQREDLEKPVEVIELDEWEEKIG